MTILLPSTAILPQFTGEWTYETAAHLMRRATFGPKNSEILSALADGLTTTLDKLFQDAPPPPPPVNHFFENDPAVPVGVTWVDKPYTFQGNDENYRYQSLFGWYFNNLFADSVTISNKMTLFWINHFGMTNVKDHRTQYQYISLFQELATGSFRELIERITVAPAMLQFLDGDVNHRDNPNENYAREMLELYTVQKGPLIAPGDYTNYTEEDVESIARCLTGWRNNNFLFSSDGTLPESYFDAQAHDNGDKQLSYHFNHALITSNGEQEYRDLLTIILAQNASAEGIVRELYKFFVYTEIPSDVELAIIQPLAAELMAEDYRIEPVLRTLLGSEHFYEMSNRGPVIKNPYEYIVSLIRPLGAYSYLNLEVKERYGIGVKLGYHGELMNMSYLFIPTVSGWRAYYDAPRFGRNWISPATLQRRKDFANDITSGLFFVYDTQLPSDWLGFLMGLTNPGQIDSLVAEVVRLFLSRPLTDGQILALREQVLQGQTPTTWSVLYAELMAEPQNATIQRLVEDKVEKLVEGVVSLPEFQLQ